MSDKQQQLLDMGFDAEGARAALAACHGNVERAIDYLFTGGPSDPPADSTSARSLMNARDVVADISQYSMDQGRSACTCIALTAAQEFLLKPAVSTATPQFIEHAIRQGVQVYQNLNGGETGSVEHMSPEEVMNLTAAGGGDGELVFSRVQLTPGGIRQGILSPSADHSHPLGLYALLEACRKDAPPDQWVTTLITKTPETVLAILPPTGSQPQYMVLDSHPRPGVVDGGGAYARILTSLDDLVLHLNTILPATELGPDVPEMMSMMYNSFDLYPLVIKK